MHYFKSFVINFLIVFFANHILPGIRVTDQTKLPHIGSDLIVAASLALLNTLLFPLMKKFHHGSRLKLGVGCLILNLFSYALIKWLPLGVELLNIEGYLMAAGSVTLGSFITHLFELKRGKKEDFPIGS